MRHAVLLLVLVSLVLASTAACSGAPARPRGDGGGEPGRDAGPGGGLDSGVMVLPDGGVTGIDAGSDPIARGDVRGDICGNMFDDDDDGMIDDGCDCAVGTERPCWLGTAESRGVGACHDGVQRCESDGVSATWTYCLDSTMPTREVIENGQDDDCDGVIDEPDGICSAASNMEAGFECANGRDDDCDTLSDCDDPGCVGMAGCPGGCDPRESLCWGGNDEDCDSLFDCDDPDCMGDLSCVTGPCPRGQTPTYRQRDLGSAWGGSYIAMGDGNAVMPMTCEAGGCPVGQVRVVLVGRPAICVPPPPACPAGTHPNYVGSGRWRCDPPCDLVVHYGSIFGGRFVCAGRPDLSCPSGQVPTFIEETETWQCRATCDNTTYDRVTLDGRTVCIPC